MQNDSNCNRSAWWRRRYIIQAMLAMKLTLFLLSAGFIRVYGEQITRDISTLSKLDHRLESNHFISENGNIAHYHIKNDRDLVSLSLTAAAMYTNHQIAGGGDHSTDTLKRIKGKVLDENNTPVEGLSVQIKGTKNGTTTDAKGEFVLDKVVETSEIVITGSNIEPVTVRVADKTLLSGIVVKRAVSSMDGVVVVGYGSLSRKDVSGSISSVTGKDIAKTPSVSFDVALQGRAPGLQITSTSAEPGGGATIRIRGNNSISGNNSPLIVLDGYPLPESNDAAADRGAPQTSNIFAFLNPTDIESVQILKDASSTAIYGARGANGVIMITTRKGKAGKTQIELGSDFGIDVPTNLLDMMNGISWATWRNEIAVKNGTPIPYDGNFLPTPDKVNDIDWLNEITRNAPYQKYNLTIMGGNNKTRYAIFGNVLNQDGLLLASNFDRITGRINLDTELSDRLSLSTSINYTQIANNRAQTGTPSIISASALFDAIRANPAVAGGKDFTSDALNPTESVYNPITQLKDKKDETLNKELFTNVTATYKVTDNLSVVLRGGLTTKQSTRDIYYPRTVNFGFLFNGVANVNNSNLEDYLLENYFNYNKKISNHTLNLTGGYSFQKSNYNDLNLTVRDFPDDILQSYGLQTGIDVLNPFSYRTERKLNSYFFRSGYNYKEKYYLSFSGRVDGSSVFAENNKYGFFPSVSASWRIDQEKFIRGSAVSTLKLRASIGATGSQAISPYGSLARISSFNYIIGDNVVKGLAPVSLSNPDLRWEQTLQKDIGLDFGLFGEKVYGAIDLYDKKTTDLLQPFMIPASTGFQSVTKNIGSIRNRGIEILLGYRHHAAGDFGWATSVNFTANRSKIIELNGVDIFGGYPAANIINFPATVMRENADFGSFYGYEIAGLIQPKDIGSGGANVPLLGGFSEIGSWKFVDKNDDGVINEGDKTIIGNPNPDFIFGWNADLSYKRFSLSFLVYGSIGNDIFNATNLFINSGYTTTANQTQDWFDNRWTQDNQHNDIRYPSSTIQATMSANSASIENASFVRLKNVVLAYDLPFKSNRSVRNIQLSLTANNLLTFTKYSGFDPEVGQYQNNNTSLGFDFGAYPRAKSFILGIKLHF